LQSFQRILALDVGLKRTGLAQSDPMQTIASPIGAFGPDEIFVQIGKIAQTSKIATIVVGWPVTLKGVKTESVKMVEAFLKKLEKKFPDIPVEVLDERFTSTMAQQTIRDSGIGKKKRRNKGLVDAVAAAILLQNYLDKNATSKFGL